MRKTILYIFLIAVAFTSCQKKEVTQVVQPAPSNAFGAVYSVMPEDWEIEGDTVLTYHADVPELTENINDHGAVMVYASFQDDNLGDPVYEALPEVFQYLSFNAIHYVGGVDVEIRDVDNLELEAPESEIFIKIVLIDAEKLAKHPNIDFQDYGEVKKAFKL